MFIGAQPSQLPTLSEYLQSIMRSNPGAQPIGDASGLHVSPLNISALTQAAQPNSALQLGAAQAPGHSLLNLASQIGQIANSANASAPGLPSQAPLGSFLLNNAQPSWFRQPGAPSQPPPVDPRNAQIAQLQGQIGALDKPAPLNLLSVMNAVGRGLSYGGANPLDVAQVEQRRIGDEGDRKLRLRQQLVQQADTLQEQQIRDKQVANEMAYRNQQINETQQLRKIQGDAEQRRAKMGAATINARLANSGYRLVDQGDGTFGTEPIPRDEMSPLQQSKLDREATWEENAKAQRSLRQAQADLASAKAANEPKRIEIAQRNVAAREAEASTKQSALNLADKKYMAQYYGTDEEGTQIPGTDTTKEGLPIGPAITNATTGKTSRSQVTNDLDRYVRGIRSEIVRQDLTGTEAQDYYERERARYKVMGVDLPAYDPRGASPAAPTGPPAKKPDPLGIRK